MEKKQYVPKTIALIAFVLTFSMLILAIVFDIVIFGEVILNFIAACILTPFLFLLFVALWFLSCIFIFGISLTDTYGFWPLDWTVKAFKEIVGEASVTSSELDLFRGIRILILVVCITTFILSIIALKMHKKAKIEGLERKTVKGFAIPAIIFSIFGIISGFGILVIISAV